MATVSATLDALLATWALEWQVWPTRGDKADAPERAIYLPVRKRGRIGHIEVSSVELAGPLVLDQWVLGLALVDRGDRIVQAE